VGFQTRSFWSQGTTNLEMTTDIVALIEFYEKEKAIER